jgi:SAM-dependent methyltransferase
MNSREATEAAGPVAGLAGPRLVMPTASTGPCWVCGGSDVRRVRREAFDLTHHPRFGPHAHGGHPDVWLVRCRACGFHQPESLPARDDYFDVMYSDQPWLTEEGMRRTYECGYKDFVFREILQDLGRRLAPGVKRTLLDVGTDIGRFLELAAAEGYDVEATEMNSRAADFAERRTGKTIRRVWVQDLVREGGRRYGVVSMIDVLEHIPRPAPLVAELFHLLEPGGVLVLKLPHGPAQCLKENLRGLIHPRAANNVGVMTRFVHVNLFSVDSLTRCLRAAGFSPVEVLTAPPEFHQAGPVRTPKERRQALVRTALYRAGRLVPGGARLPISFNLVAYAVKPRGAD